MTKYLSSRLLSRSPLIKVCLFFASILVIAHHLHSSACIIGLIPARNESFQIIQCIKALAPYVDGIVYLDDASTDDSVTRVKSIAHEYNVLQIIEKKVWHRDEPSDRNTLLNAGRALGGTHFIVIDADEMFTANCLNGEFLRKKILALKPGDKLFLNWIQLWRSTDYYRFDQSIWTWNYKDIIFCDDGYCSYSSDFIHTPRCPSNLKGHNHLIKGYNYGLLHFQFVNWRNLLVKQAWYRCLELTRNAHASTQRINNSYAPSKNEEQLRLKACPKKWFKGYAAFFDSTIYSQKEEWREQQVLQWFSEYGEEFFKDLDIWDIDWGR